MGSVGISQPGALTYISDKDRIGKYHIDDNIREQAQNMVQFRGYVRPVNKFGMHKGQGVEIEKYRKMSTSETPINELQSIPLKRTAINFVQTVINEYGDGLIFTEKAMTIAEYAFNETLKSLLAKNIAETLDKVASVEFRANATEFATPRADDAHVLDKDGTITTTANADVDAEFLRWLHANLTYDNMPKYDGRHYVALVNPFTSTQIFSDTAAGGWIDTLKYTQPERLIQGEIGAFLGFRFVVENNVLDSNLGGGGTAYTGEMIIVGDDAVAEAIAKPESVMTDNWDFGRFNAIAWNAFLGYKKVWNNNDDAQYSLVRVYSA